MSILGTAQNAAQNLSSQIPSGNNALDSILGDKAILRPKSLQGIAGFIFDYEGETSVNYSSEITDHYTENNTAIQDHIAIKPSKVTLKGYVGELVLKAPQGVTGLLQTISNKLTTVPAYLGKYTPQALDKINNAVSTAQTVANSVNNAIMRTKNVLNMFSGQGATTSNQQAQFFRLQALFESKTIFSVQTPYQTYDNMIVESFTAVQDELTKSWSEFTVVLKELRFASTLTSKSSVKIGRASGQSTLNQDRGRTAGKSLDVNNYPFSVSNNLTNKF